MKRLGILLAVLAAAALAWTARELYRPHKGFTEDQLIEIAPGTKATQVAAILVERGVLASRWPFLLRYWISRHSATLKAGEYFFDRELRPADVYRKLALGEVFLHSVVIPEGSDRFDAARILHEQMGVDSEDFLRATQDPASIRDLDPSATTLEGYLFPDTYKFPRGASAQAVVKAMLGRFRQVIRAKLPEEFLRSPETLHDLITLASLVEKETPAPEERPVIAGVFVRRLEKGWPLQCDPTVVYAVRLSGRTIGSITQSDLAFKSPYNTYLYPGLPPGPIANPGEAAILAALNPAQSGFLYFVSNNQGSHFFAKTLAEHNRNVARYRRELAQSRRVKETSAPGPANDGSRRRKRNRSETPKGSEKGGQSEQQETNHPRVLPGA